MRLKVLVEGDENLIEPHEILITSDENFDAVLKEKSEKGLKTSVVLTIEDFIGRLEAAHQEGYDEGYQAGYDEGYAAGLADGQA